MKSNENGWLPPPDQPLIGDAEVHLWLASLDVSPERLAALQETLSLEEQERAARYHAQRHRDRFVAARAVLRAILATYLNTAPSHLSFTYGPNGKPELAGLKTLATVKFNLSHTDHWALYAVAKTFQVGVDIERMRPEVEVLSIAQRFFAAGEFSALRALPPSLQRAAFFRCWVRKEAMVKALGESVFAEFTETEVSVAPGAQPALIRLGRHLE